MIKKLLVALLICSQVQAAEIKISALPELPGVSIAPLDALPIVDVSETTTKKVTVQSFDTRWLTPQSLLAPIASPVFTGNPRSPTKSPSDNSSSIATTAYVDNAVSGISGTVVSVFGRSGVVTAQSGDYTKTQVGLGNVDNTTDLGKPISTATQTALNLKADLASPALTGTPTAPTASPGDNTTKIASTAFVTAAVGAIPAGGITSLTGEVTASGSGAVAATVTNGAVIGKVLTGYTSGAGTVAATDTILQAVQKLNGNDGLAQARSALTTKGDIYVATASGVTTRLPAGTDGYVLVADSSQASGLNYVTPPSAGGRAVSTFTTTFIASVAAGDESFTYNGSSAQTFTGFGTISGFTTGKRIAIVCTSDTNTLMINPNDATNGWLMNGSFECGKASLIEFQYNVTLARMIEVTRNQ